MTYCGRPASVINETLVVAVGVFHRHQREEGGIFVRTVFRHHQRGKAQCYRTVQRSNDIMPVRIFTEPNLFALKQYRFFIIFIHFRQTHTDGEGHTTSYEYGQDGLPTRRTNALGHTFGYHYDKARRLVGLTNENGARYRLS